MNSAIESRKGCSSRAEWRRGEGRRGKKRGESTETGSFECVDRCKMRNTRRMDKLVEDAVVVVVGCGGWRSARDPRRGGLGAVRERRIAREYRKAQTKRAKGTNRFQRECQEVEEDTREEENHHKETATRTRNVDSIRK